MKDIAISVFGLFSSVIVVAILVFLELEWEFAFYSVMHYFVIPTGAIVSGVGAAAGYYFGARFLNSKPTWRILFYMVAISTGTYFTLNYAIYLLLEVDGSPVSSLINFSGYMDVYLTNMSMTIGSGNTETGELGSLGYVVALLQIIGFAGGGFATYLFLKGMPFFDLCDKYYKNVFKVIRYSGESNSDKLVESVKNIADALDNADVAGARSLHNRVGVAKNSKKTHLRSKLSLEKCPECRRQVASFETSKKNGNDWDVIDDLSFSNNYPGRKDTAMA